MWGRASAYKFGKDKNIQYIAVPFPLMRSKHYQKQ
jgi:hypothetical protein